MPRLRQVVLAARDLAAASDDLARSFGLGPPYRDPLVAHFGLENAVFAVGDTFLEVVCPRDTSIAGARTAARQIERAGQPACGYMAMVQVEDLAAARARAASAGVREVFAVELDDVAEVHLHPADAGGAILALTEPAEPREWRWGGAGWRERSVPGRIRGIEIAVSDPDATAERWHHLAGGPIPGVGFVADQGRPGIASVALDLDGTRRTLRPENLCCGSA